MKNIPFIGSLVYPEIVLNKRWYSLSRHTGHSLSRHTGHSLQEVDRKEKKR